MPPKSVNIQNKYVDMQGSYAIMRVTDLLENFVLTWVNFFYYRQNLTPNAQDATLENVLNIDSIISSYELAMVQVTKS